MSSGLILPPERPDIQVTVPVDWEPRSYQQPLWKFFQEGGTRGVMVWHRRGGKDLTSMNLTICKAMERVGTYWHVLPTYRQGRKIVWDGMMGNGRKFMSLWPKEMIARKRDDEMTLWLANDSMWQVVGADNINRLVGTNPVGVVFSEYSLMDPSVWDFIRPILAENGGWALFIFTPRGRNHAHKLFQMSQDNPDWFSERLTVEDTNAIPLSVIQEERDSGMPEEMIQQEYYCSFDAPLVGAYYAKQMTAAANDKRITKVDWETTLPVYTAWDLGMADATAIIFFQILGREIRIIDYYFASGQGLDHYHKKLLEKPYAYEEHIVPHDARVRELGTGKSRYEIMKEMGFGRIRVMPKLGFQDGIQAARSILPRVYFDETKADTLIRGLSEYTRQQIEGARNPDNTPVFREQPVHNWASHPADAFRQLALSLRKYEKRKTGPARAAPMSIV